MAEAENLFSESWHLVAPLRIRLRPDLQVRRQLFRGEPWWVVCDGLNQQFFRLRPAAYRFLGRLDGRRTVEEIWQDGVVREPEDTPGQQEIVQLVAQLAEASLIQSERAGDSLRQFTQRQKRQQRQFRQQALNFLFLRIPLFDPDALLTWLSPAWRVMISRVGAAVWLIAVLLGLKLALEHWAALRDHGQGVLAPANLGWLYLASIGLKLWHELGHGAICKRFGGEVRSFGVMLMVFLPLPYVDASASHGFRERSARVLTGMGGMAFELFAAALAMVVWVYTAPGVINQVAYNVIFLASISTLIFNLNPLLRFDGYFILCDLAETPNLGQRAQRQLKFLLEKYAFGLPRLTGVGVTRREVTWLALYGVASAGYRVFVLWTIVLFLGDRFFGVGLLLAAFGVVLWGVLPLGRYVNYLFTDARLEVRRPRVLAVSGAALATVALLICVVPAPNRFQTPGVVRADPATAVVSASEGVIAERFVQPGATVAADQPLLRLANPDLESRRVALVAAVEESEARRRFARENLPAQLAALERRLEAVRAQLAEMERQQAGLIVRAPHAGRWAGGGVDYPPGLFVPRGAGLGEIVGDGKFVFTAIVSQEEAARIFSDPIRHVRVRVAGQAGTTLESPHWKILPGDQRRLPTAALGWQGGGVIAVEQDDRNATTTTEPFFEVAADLPATAAVTLLHLRGGQAKFSMEARPLAVQWWRSLRQLLQKRYQL